MRIDIYGTTGVPLRALLVPANSPNFNKVSFDEAVIEFYDLRYSFTPDGQFISRYNLKTFLEGSGGLCLDGGVTAWNISGVTRVLIMKWLKYLEYWA